MINLSIIIVNYNAKNILSQCLNSIYENTRRLDFEVLLVDNGSTDSSSSMLKEKFPNVRLIQNSKNLGFAKALNQGLQEAKGKYLACLNNDTIVLEGCLNSLREFMDKNPDAAIVGGQILDSERKIEFSCRGFPRFHTLLFNRYSLLTRLFPNNRFSREYLLNDWHHNEIREVDWVSAAFLGMRREILTHLGLFDERFFMFCEDVDFCLRAKQKGYKIFYFPEAKIIHYSSKTKEKKFKKTIWHHISMYRFYKKHCNKFLVADILVAIALMARVSFILMIDWLRR